MDQRCILCEGMVPPQTALRKVTPTMPGAICARCMALPAAERDALRSHAMTRMLLHGS